MKDEHREKLNNRLTPIHLYKLTPRTNCGECGLASCLAFATQVATGQADLDACPYLDGPVKESLSARLSEQHQAGIGLRREGFEKALQFLRGEIGKWNFETIASSLGAELLDVEGRPALEIDYFGEPVTVTRDDVTRASGEGLNPWEKILILNYVIGGATEPSGVWVGMEKLPNSVSKIKSLKAHCEDRLAKAFAGKMHELRSAVSSLGQELPLAEEKVDVAAEFRILPNLSVRIFWWDEDQAEGFQSQAKFVFDGRVLQVVDLESLLFACEQLTDRLLESGTGA